MKNDKHSGTPAAQQQVGKAAKKTMLNNKAIKEANAPQRTPEELAQKAAARKKRRIKLARSYFLTIFLLANVYLILNVLLKSGRIDNYFAGIIYVVGINIILAVSLNLTTGYLGQLTLGHAGFMAIGAYASALFSKFMAASAMLAFVPQWARFSVSLLFGALLAALMGVLIGLPALRLQGDYLAIITLGFGEIIRVIMLNLNFTGGAKGLSGIPRTTTFTAVYVCAVITVVAIYSLIKSRHGRAIISIREDETAAAASGIPTTYYKTLAFITAAFFAGLAGGLYAHYLGILVPASFGFGKSVEIVVMVVLGGMGSIIGSIVSAIFLTLLPELLRGFAAYRMLIYSLLLVLVMIFKPKGLISDEGVVGAFKKLGGRFAAQRDKKNKAGAPVQATGGKNSGAGNGDVQNLAAKSDESGAGAKGGAPALNGAELEAKGENIAGDKGDAQNSQDAQTTQNPQNSQNSQGTNKPNGKGGI